MIEDRRNKRVIFASVFKEQETILLVTNKSINDKMKDKKEYARPMMKVLEFDMQFQLLTGSGTSDPLVPEDI